MSDSIPSVLCDERGKDSQQWELCRGHTGRKEEPSPEELKQLDQDHAAYKTPQYLKEVQLAQKPYLASPDLCCLFSTYFFSQ